MLGGAAGLPASAKRFVSGVASHRRRQPRGIEEERRGIGDRSEDNRDLDSARGEGRLTRKRGGELGVENLMVMVDLLWKIKTSTLVAHLGWWILIWACLGLFKAHSMYLILSENYGRSR